MLAYSVIHALAKHWRDLDVTIQEGLDQLASLCLTEIHFPNRPVSHRLPIPRDSVKQLLAAAQVRLPSKVVAAASGVTTKTKLADGRK